MMDLKVKRLLPERSIYAPRRTELGRQREEGVRRANWSESWITSVSLVKFPTLLQQAIDWGVVSYISQSPKGGTHTLRVIHFNFSISFHDSSVIERGLLRR